MARELGAMHAACYWLVKVVVGHTQHQRRCMDRLTTDAQCCRRQTMLGRSTNVPCFIVGDPTAVPSRRGPSQSYCKSDDELSKPTPLLPATWIGL